MEITNDTYKYFCRHDAEQKARLDSRPVCYACGEPIRDDLCYGFNGHKYCLECRETVANAVLIELLEFLA